MPSMVAAVAVVVYLVGKRRKDTDFDQLVTITWDLDELASRVLDVLDFAV